MVTSTQYGNGAVIIVEVTCSLIACFMLLPTYAEPCCALKYYPEIEICVKEQKGEQEAKRKEAQRLEDENFGTKITGKIRTFLWNLMEYPETSKYAQVRTWA